MQFFYCFVYGSQKAPKKIWLLNKCKNKSVWEPTRWVGLNSFIFKRMLTAPQQGLWIRSTYKVHLASNHSPVATLSSEIFSNDHAVSLSRLVSERLFNVCWAPRWLRGSSSSNTCTGPETVRWCLRSNFSGCSETVMLLWPLAHLSGINWKGSFTKVRLSESYCMIFAFIFWYHCMSSCSI